MFNADKKELERQWDELVAYLRELGADGGLTLAFSGGADSSLLTAAAIESGVRPLLAITVVSELHSAVDIELAGAAADEMKGLFLSGTEKKPASDEDAGIDDGGFSWVKLEMSALALPSVAGNAARRCYYCKQAMLAQIAEYSAARGVTTLIEGSNADDATQDRPGLWAAQEAGVHQPLLTLGIKKAAVRALAARHGLSAATLPSAPCLATRFSVDTPLTVPLLRQVEAGEAALRALGFTELRLRVRECGRTAQLELTEQQLSRAFRMRQDIADALKGVGYKNITLDLSPLSRC